MFILWFILLSSNKKLFIYCKFGLFQNLTGYEYETPKKLQDHMTFVLVRRRSFEII